MKTKIMKLDPKAVIPSKAHATDTGYDLTVIGVEKIVGNVIYFKTGLAVQSPEGFYFEIVPRSSISKLPLSLANSVGVVDESYRGELLIAIRVHSREAFFLNEQPETLLELAKILVEKQPRIAQLILRKRYDTDFEVVQNLEETERGDGGFGSSGQK